MKKKIVTAPTFYRLLDKIAYQNAIRCDSGLWLFKNKRFKLEYLFGEMMDSVCVYPVSKMKKTKEFDYIWCYKHKDIATIFIQCAELSGWEAESITCKESLEWYEANKDKKRNT